MYDTTPLSLLDSVNMQPHSQNNNPQNNGTTPHRGPSSSANASNAQAIEQLVNVALHMRRLGQTSDPRYHRILLLLKQYHEHTPQLVRDIMHASSLFSSGLPPTSSSTPSTSASMSAATSMSSSSSSQQNSMMNRSSGGGGAPSLARPLGSLPVPVPQQQQHPSSSSSSIPTTTASMKLLNAQPRSGLNYFSTNARLTPTVSTGGGTPTTGTSSSTASLFTSPQLAQLRQQIEQFKSLSRTFQKILTEQPAPSSSSTTDESATSLSDDRATLASRAVTGGKTLTGEPEVDVTTTGNHQKKDGLNPTTPRWKRQDKDTLYFGPPQHDGNLIPVPMYGFGPFNVGNWYLTLDLQMLYDERERRLQDKMNTWSNNVRSRDSRSPPLGEENQHDVDRSSANTTTPPLDDMLSKQKRLKKSPQQLLSTLVPVQSDLRRQLSHIHERHLAAMGEPLIVDRKCFRRQVRQSRDEIQKTDRQARQKYIEREQERRQEHQVYLRAVMAHSREFFSYHKSLQSSLARVAKAAKAVLDQKSQKAEREEDRQEKLRLKALKANDMEAYGKLVAEAKNERLTYLLSQTDQYLDDIRELIRGHRVKHGLASAADPADDLNYLGVAQSGELPRQPQMLVGGDLKEYQLRGLQWMGSLYDNRLNGILADEMGLGKTIQSIALITHVMENRNNNGPFLVVVPLSTLSNWVNEFKKWAPDASLVVYKGAPAIRKDIFKEEMASGQFNVLLTTYEYIMKDRNVLKKYHWQYIIVDEGHRMKNAQSKFAQTLGNMYTSRNRLLLTGTPLQNSLPELWALLNFLLPTIFNSVENFEQWFSKPFAQFSGTGETNELSDEERMVIINRLHQILRPFLLRRVKANVLGQLPEKVERVLKCDLSGWQKILYRQCQESGAILIDPEAASASSSSRNTKSSAMGISRGLSNIIMQLRKVCNHPYLFQLAAGYRIDFTIVRCSGKFELLDRMLPKLKAAGHRVLMFSQMTQLMTILEDYFTWRGFRYLRLDGSTSADEREQRMFQFNAPDSPYFIFLLSTRAGGLGLNLATADTVILFDSDWNPAMDAQAQDRAHRIGQKNEVRVFRLVTNSPIEEKILSRATDKLNMNNLIVEAGKFNNRSKEAERKAMLENLLRLESEENKDEEDERGSLLDDDQINEMMALTDEELVLYQEMDERRIQAEARDWEELKQQNVHLEGSIPSRLMSEKDVPTWLKDASQYMDRTNQEQQALVAAGGGLAAAAAFTKDSARKRKEISYRDLSDAEFTRMVETGDDPSKSSSSNMNERRPEDDDSADRANYAKMMVEPEEMEQSDSDVMNHGGEKRKKRPSSASKVSVGGKRKKGGKVKAAANIPFTIIVCRAYFKIYTLVESTTDETTGRSRSQLYLKKPSKTLYPDYYQIITDPIDLSSIRKKIEKQKYYIPASTTTLDELKDPKSHAMFLEDFGLLFGNALIYNHPDSFVYHDSVEMKKIFDQEMNKLYSTLNWEYELEQYQLSIQHQQQHHEATAASNSEESPSKSTKKKKRRRKTVV